MPLLRPLYRTNSRKQATNFPIQITLIHNVWSSAFDGSTRVLSMSFRGAMFRCIVVSLIAMLTALASSSVTSTSAALWSWPLDPAPAVLRAFHRPTHPWMSGHRGVDLAARFRQEIYAPADGVVVFTGRVVNRTVISLEVKSGHSISFEPVADPAPKGSKVRAGDVIAHRDPAIPHEPCGPCLHWGVRNSDDYVNPLLFVGATAHSVLWPLPAARPSGNNPD